MLLEVGGDYSSREEYPTLTFLHLVLQRVRAAALDVGFPDKSLVCFGGALVFPALLVMARI